MNSVAQAPRTFSSPETQLAGVDINLAQRIISAAADIALVLSPRGEVLDVSVTSEDLAAVGVTSWAGRHWQETATTDSHPKIEKLLASAISEGASEWRQLNHLDGANPGGRPVQWKVLALDMKRLIAFGRDLAPMANMQQRLVAAQQSMEQDYIRLHQAQMRYRLLFQRSREPVMIVDARTRRVVEVNPAAQRLLGDTGDGVVGRELKHVFELEDGGAIDGLLAQASASGTADDVSVSIAYTQRRCEVSASLFRDRAESFFLVRIDTPDRIIDAAPTSPGEHRLREVVERLPDAFVITDLKGRILTANAAYLDLVQLVSTDQIYGESLARWLAREDLDLQVMLTNLESHRTLRLFQTALKGEFGTRTEVEISAVVIHDEQPCAGFSIRNIARRLELNETAQPAHLPASVDQLKELVGHVPLKELVRDATDTIEKMCINAALELTGNNRASAAEVLGLSRQSLYVKLHRYGLNDNNED